MSDEQSVKRPRSKDISSWFKKSAKPLSCSSSQALVSTPIAIGVTEEPSSESPLFGQQRNEYDPHGNLNAIERDPGKRCPIWKYPVNEREAIQKDDFYEQAKQNQAAKRGTKAVMRSRSSSVPSLPETVGGRRYITYEMEKNRGLTRTRNKDTKNPRKKYKVRYENKIKNRKGQVREIKKPIGPYGGETSGINPTISRSARFKN